jgi:Na+-driven multidrug efflux pump
MWGLGFAGPGTVLCDNLCYVFMFLSVATSNLIATSLAQKDEDEAAGHLSRLLFVAVTCGVAMLIFTQFGVDGLLRGFVGAENANMIPAARTYVQIRALAWPAVLVGLVSQSARYTPITVCLRPELQCGCILGSISVFLI